MDSNMEILDEVNGLIEKLRSGWRQIPMSKRNSQHQG
jgi:flagellin-specific chaperone FliS